MKWQQRLLQNEIKHLGQIIQSLSYELIVLQDFLKDEYESRFENFRANYSATTATANSSSLSSATRSQKQSADSTKSVVEVAENMEANVSEGNKDALVNDAELTDSEIEYNEALSDSDKSTTLKDKDPLATGSYEERRGGGRRKTKIWKYFDKITHRNNKFSARCHICRSLVSSRASRMVEHRVKCKRLRNNPRLMSTKNHAREIRDEMRRMQWDGHDEGEFSDEESYACSDNDKSANEDIKLANRRTGRSLDTIWKYFEVVYPDEKGGLKKAKCTSCGLFVSPKAVRMRQHKIGCKGKERDKGARGCDKNR